MELNTIINGDCLEVMKQIPDNSIDMILCDLPYGTTRNSWDIKLPFDILWYEYKRTTKRNAAIVLFSQMPFTYEWVYQKTMATGFLNARKMPMKAHENICVFYRALPVYNPQRLYVGTNYFKKREGPITSANYNTHTHLVPSESKDGTRYPRDVITFKTHANNAQCNSNRYHSTEKPVELCEYLIRTYTNENDIVLDNCAGCGSSLIGAINAGRNFIGIEKDINYYNIACDRIERAKIETIAF